MPKSNILIVLLFMFFFCKCSSGPNNVNNILATSAIDGLVLKGPISPVERNGVPNTTPLAGAQISITNTTNGVVIANVISDTSGKFLVKVSAGTYICTPQQINGNGFP